MKNKIDLIHLEKDTSEPHSLHLFVNDVAIAHQAVEDNQSIDCRVMASNMGNALATHINHHTLSMRDIGISRESDLSVSQALAAYVLNAPVANAADHTIHLLDVSQEDQNLSFHIGQLMHLNIKSSSEGVIIDVYTNHDEECFSSYAFDLDELCACLLYTSPSPRDRG